MANKEDDDVWGTLGVKPAAPGAAGDDAAVWSTLGTAKPAARVPTQSMGPIPANDPVGQSTGTPIQEGRVPGFTAQAIASLPTDPEQKRRIIAKQLFPDLDQKAAEARIFPGVGGRLAAVGMDGKAFYIEPLPSNVATDPYSPASIAGTLPTTDLSARAGSVVGPALPAAGGVGGGAIAGPTSVFWGPAGAATGAAAGDFLRQKAAGYFDPTPGATPYNALQTGGEAVGAGVGQLVGAGLLRTFAPARMGIRIGELNPNMLADAEHINRLAQGMDVNLTPGMLSGAPSILASEDAIASGTAGRAGQDVAGRQYGSIRNALTGAWERYVLNPLSNAADKTDAALQFQQGAEDATRIVRQQANALARPSYDAARAGGQPLSPDLALLMDNPAIQDAMTRAARDYRTIIGRDAPNIPDFDYWNLTKQQLDDAYNVARRAGENATAAAIDTARRRLLTNLDAAFPTYEAARAISAPGQRLAARMEDATGRAVGTGTGTEAAEAIVNPVFKRNPRAIAEQRDAFIQAGREDEWNAGTRAYLQSVFDNASKSQDGLQAATLRMQLWGKPGAREAMQAAMSPEAFQGLENYMQVIEAAARARGMNSATAGRLATAEELRQAAETGGAAGFRIAGNVAGDITNPWKAFGLSTLAKTGLHNVADRLSARGLQRMMEGIFSPDGMQFLRQMAAVSPMSEKALTASANFVGQQVADRRVAPPARWPAR
jgi:hypothetical protein